MTTYRYNAAGLIDQVLQTHEGTALSTRTLSYDAYGRPASVTDAEGLVRSLVRDDLGRVIQEQATDGSTVAYHYDALGRIKE